LQSTENTRSLQTDSVKSDCNSHVRHSANSTRKIRPMQSKRLREYTRWMNWTLMAWMTH